jgi:hypothetical protein
MSIFLSILIHAFIVFAYFSLLLWKGWRQSGGDMFVVFGTQFIALLHILVIAVMGFLSKKKTYNWGIPGVILGVVICLAVFKFWLG